MECRKCNEQIPEGAIFCPWCGAAQSPKPRKSGKRGNGEGTVFQRGKTWTVRIILGWWVDDDGVAHPHLRTKGGFKTKREALEYIPELKKQGNNPDTNITFQQLYDRWVKEHEQKVGAGTMRGYASAFQHFKPIWGLRFRDLGTDDMQECLDDGEKGRRTKELMKALAGSLYKYAASRKIVSHNYAQYLFVGRDKKGTHPAFSLLQVEKIRRAAASGDIRAVYTLCLIYLGFRPNEMLSLRREAYNKDGEMEYLVGGFKTEAGTDRKVTISPKIRPYLYELILKANPYIFPRQDGKLMDDKWFRDRYFYPLLSDLGIQPVPDKEHPAVLVPYSTRHTFANLMKAVEGSDTDKAALMGHSDASMTKYYQSYDLESIFGITNKI